jgi:hypothetical protein
LVHRGSRAPKYQPTTIKDDTTLNGVDILAQESSQLVVWRHATVTRCYRSRPSSHHNRQFEAGYDRRNDGAE